MIYKNYAHLAERKLLLRNLRERGKNVLFVSFYQPRGYAKHILLCIIRRMEGKMKQKNQRENREKSHILSEFARYVSLNVLGMLALSCYILADTFFISKGLGARGLTALNLAIPIYNFIHGSGLMIGMGARRLNGKRTVPLPMLYIWLEFLLWYLCLPGYFCRGKLPRY